MSESTTPPPTGPWAADSAAAAPLPTAPAPSPAHLLETERLDRRVVVYWWLAGLVSTAILAAVVGGVLFVAQRELQQRDLWTTALTVGVVLVGLKMAWTIVAPPLSWVRWRWGMDHELLVLRWGIISHHERAIPISRLQHVDLTRGPIERLFGLTTLVVHTAGTSAASFDLPGLADAEARALRDRILAARGDDVV
jgi:membrane protein YdbS with pleckstrin-like domain